MNKCKRNIILIFGYLLIMAILFVPYESETVQIVQGPAGSIKGDTDRGFVFIPVFVKNYTKYRDMDLEKYFKSIKDNPKQVFSPVITKYLLNIDLLITEMYLIIVVAGFIFILFCVVLRKQ